MYRRTAVLWTLAFLTFGVGDVTTTYVGLNTPGVMEGNAVPAFFIRRYGLLGMIGMKIGMLGSLGMIYLGLEDRDNPARYGIPVGLTIIGIPVTAWNLYILSVAF